MTTNDVLRGVCLSMGWSLVATYFGLLLACPDFLRRLYAKLPDPASYGWDVKDSQLRRFGLFGTLVMLLSIRPLVTFLIEKQVLVPVLALDLMILTSFMGACLIGMPVSSARFFRLSRAERLTEVVGPSFQLRIRIVGMAVLTLSLLVICWLICGWL